MTPRAASCGSPTSTADQLTALLDLAAAMRADPTRLAPGARRPDARLLLHQAVHADARLVRGRGVAARHAARDAAARRAAARPRRAARGHRARALRLRRAIVIRTFAQADVEALAARAAVPVINALTDDHHPCQALADLLTLRERFGDLEGLTVAYLGDGNNVAHSLMEAAALAGMDVVVATPTATSPTPTSPRRTPARGRRRGHPTRGACAAPTPSTPTSGSRWARTAERDGASPRSRRTASTAR